MVLGRSERTYLITPSAVSSRGQDRRSRGPRLLPSSRVFCTFVSLTCCLYRAPGVRLDSGSWRQGQDYALLDRGSRPSQYGPCGRPYDTPGNGPPTLAELGFETGRRQQNDSSLVLANP